MKRKRGTVIPTVARPFDGVKDTKNTISTFDYIESRMVHDVLKENKPKARTTLDSLHLTRQVQIDNMT
jgi:hypothetical protein